MKVNKNINGNNNNKTCKNNISIVQYIITKLQSYFDQNSVKLYLLDVNFFIA